MWRLCRCCVDTILHACGCSPFHCKKSTSSLSRTRFRSSMRTTKPKMDGEISSLFLDARQKKKHFKRRGEGRWQVKNGETRFANLQIITSHKSRISFFCAREYLRCARFSTLRGPRKTEMMKWMWTNGWMWKREKQKKLFHAYIYLWEHVVWFLPLAFFSAISAAGVTRAISFFERRNHGSLVKIIRHVILYFTLRLSLLLPSSGADDVTARRGYKNCKMAHPYVVFKLIIIKLIIVDDERVREEMKREMIGWDFKLDWRISLSHFH